MRTVSKLLPVLCIPMLFWGCEQPKSPDFKLQQRIQAPLTINNEYQFLGNNKALIDTTSDDFDSLFTVDSDGLVRLSRQEDFDFGSLDDAIPVIDVAPTTINSQVGELEIGDFTSGAGSNVGTASFNDISGLSAGAFSPGDPIPDANPSPTANIPLNTDYFVSAVLKENGSLELTLTNNLGFEADQLNITLNAGGTSLGSTTVAPLNDNTTATATINLSAGDNLNNLNVDINAVWTGKTIQRTPDELVINDVLGNNLVASQVTAVLPSQDFSSSGSSTVDDSDFEFTDPDHFVELESGELRIFDILNGIPLAIQNAQISFPDIRTGPGYGVGDSLVISTNIPRAVGGNPGQAPDQTIDLSDVRIYATGNTIDYNISGTTEDTQQGAGSGSRTVSENDEISANVEINNLAVRSAEGILKPRNVVVNNDDPANGVDIVDLFNDDEAELVDISELGNISEQLSGLEFTNPELSIQYATNIGVDATVIGAILGVDPTGNQVYLSGVQGEPTFVNPAEVPSELQANGGQLTNTQLIKFDLNKSTDGSSVMGANTFDVDNSNVAEFLNILPTTIRFVGVARLNENSAEGNISDPVQFDPNLSLDLPIQLSASASMFSDTTSADLADLPGDGDDQKLTEAILTVGYENGLPFQLNVSLKMLDGEQNLVTEVPLATENPLVIGAASVDAGTRFVTSANEGKVSFSLNRDQLDVLNQTRELVIEVIFNTTNQDEVKVRAEDSINLSIKMNTAIETEIKN